MRARCAAESPRDRPRRRLLPPPLEDETPLPERPSHGRRRRNLSSGRRMPAPRMNAPASAVPSTRCNGRSTVEWFQVRAHQRQVPDPRTSCRWCAIRPTDRVAQGRFSGRVENHYARSPTPRRQRIDAMHGERRCRSIAYGATRFISHFPRTTGRGPLGPVARIAGAYPRSGIPGAHSRFPGHALTPTGVMAIRCKQFHLPDL